MRNQQRRAVSQRRTTTLTMGVVSLTCVCWSLFGAGCPATPSDGDGSLPVPPPRTIPADTAPTILSPTTSKLVASGDVVELVYQVTNPVDDLRVSAFLQNIDTGRRGALRENLSISGQTVLLQTAGLPAGGYLPSVEIDNGTETKLAQATGPDGVVTITIRGVVGLVFSSPTSSGPFQVGEQIRIVFNLTNLTEPADYEVFFDTDLNNDGLPDGARSMIHLGRGTSGEFTWTTGSLLPGRYFIGVSVETRDLAITEFLRASDGSFLPIILDEPAGIVVTAPANDQIVIPVPCDPTDPANPCTEVEIRLTVEDRDSRAIVRVFLDENNTRTDRGETDGLGETTIEEFEIEAGVPIRDRKVTLTLDPSALLAPPGTYFIGASVASLGSGDTAAAVDYAPGKIEIVSGPTPAITLACAAPIGTDCVCNSPEDRENPDGPLRNLVLSLTDGMQLGWKAFDSTENERVDMRVYLDPDRFPLSGNELLFDEKLNEADPGGGGTCYSATVAAVGSIGVRPGRLYNVLLEIKDGDVSEPITVYAPVTVLVKGRSIGIDWLGNVGRTIDGGRFIGQQPGDRVGSTVLGMSDRNNDRRAEFLVAAGKANFDTGVATMTFGSNLRINSDEVPFGTLGSVRFFGIPSLGSNLGMAEISLMGDVDEDGFDELIFGIPHANGFPPDAMAANGHFLAGGIVIVSSRNLGLSPSSLFAGPVSNFISLNSVGRFFFCEDGNPCTTGPPDDWCDDLWQPQDGPFGLQCLRILVGGLQSTVIRVCEPAAACFQSPLVTTNCIWPVEDPDCPCDLPANLSGFPLMPGHWAGGTIEPLDEWTGDGLQQGQVEPYGARILGPRDRPANVIIDCDANGDPDDPATYATSTLAFDSAGRFGSVVNAGAESFTSSGNILVVDPTENGNAGVVHLVLRRPSTLRAALGLPTNYWMSRLELPIDFCEWGTPDPNDPFFPFPCTDVMDFEIPRPHQYQIPFSGGPEGFVGSSGGQVTGPAGSRISTAVNWEVGDDGLLDIVVGAPGDNDLGRNAGGGALYVLLGRDFTGGIANVADVTDANFIGPGNLRGTKIIGKIRKGNTGRFFDNVQLGETQPVLGDMNGDAAMDLVVGMPRANMVLVIFGGVDLDGNGIMDLVERFDPANDPWTVDELVAARLAIIFDGNDPTNPVKPARRNTPDVDVNDDFGYAVAVAGDFDRDLVDDILITAPGSNATFRTELFSDTEALTSVIFVKSGDGMTLGTTLRIAGEPTLPIIQTVESRLGGAAFRVQLDRPLLQAHAAGEQIEVQLEDAGKVYVIYGRRDLAQPADLNEAVFRDGHYFLFFDENRAGPLDGFVTGDSLAGTAQFQSAIFVGREAEDQVGGYEDSNIEGQGSRKLVAIAGDVDGDGLDDILIGAPAADPINRQDAGEAYLIYSGQ